jgi:hypothetical protein
MSQDIVQGTSSGAPSSSIDALAPVSSKSLFWRAGYVRKSTFLEHIPLLFWVVEHARPTMAVTLGVADAVPHFAICQAVERLNLEAICFGVDTENDTDLSEAIAYNEEQFPNFSEIIADNPAGILAGAQIDLLVVNAPLTQALADTIDSTWLALLSDRALILFTKGGDANLFATYVKRLALGGDVFTADAALGVCLVLRGEEHNDRLARLVRLKPGKPGYLNIKHVFSRVGELHRNSFEVKQTASALGNTRKQRDEALSTLKKKELEANDAQSKLTQITGYLKTATAQISTIRSEGFDDRNKLAESKAALDDLHKKISEMEQQHEAALSEAQQAHEQERATLTHAHEQLEARLTEAESAREKDHASSEKASKELEDLRKTITRMEVEQQQHEAALSQAQQAHEQERATLTHAHEQLEGRLTEAESAREKDHASSEKASKELQELRTTTADMEATLAQAARARDAAIDSTAQRYVELAILTRAQEDFVKELETLRNQQDAHETETQWHFGEVAILTRTLEEHQERIKQQSAALEAYQHTSKQEKERTARSEKARAKAAEDLAIAKTRLDQAKLKHSTVMSLAAAKEETALVMNGSRVSKIRRALQAKLESHVELIRKSELFDTAWYCETYPDVTTSPLSPIEHFVQMGGYECRNPGAKFDSMKYHMAYPEVAINKMPALVHYLLHGKSEGRKAIVVKS